MQADLCVAVCISIKEISNNGVIWLSSQSNRSFAHKHTFYNTYIILRGTSKDKCTDAQSWISTFIITAKVVKYLIFLCVIACP